MFENLKDYFHTIFSSRIKVMIAVMIFFSGILVGRLFVLQMIRGAEYQTNYNLLVEKKETIDATRGNIYDRNGQLLAYNELAYAVTIEDNGSYSSKKEKNKSLNHDLAEIIRHLEKNGDAIDNNFGIILNSAGDYQFVDSGTALQRFRADVFGKATIDQLVEKNREGYNEIKATPDEVMEYLMGDTRYDVSPKYNKELRYKIAVLRYKMGLNSYQKYISTTIASNVSAQSVAYIKENQNELTGVEVEKKSVRKYVDSECFSHIIGYTGQISTEEYEKLSKKSDAYTLTDIIGKAGIEQYMNEQLAGTKGSETVYVDNVGNPIEVTDHVDAVSGNHVYLSIEKDLQVATYHLLEQEIAGILYSKIINTKEYHPSGDSAAKDIMVPIYDVYYALINNNLINIYHFDDSDASETERAVHSAYSSKKDQVMRELEQLLRASQPTVYDALSDEYQKYSTHIVTMLKSQGVFDANAIDTGDDMQKQWTSEKLSVNEYLTYAIEQNWIDITKYSTSSKYADVEELYDSLVDYILQALEEDSSFTKLVYKYVILQDYVSGNQLCAILYDQGVLPEDEATHRALLSGSISAFGFMKDKIKTLQITPGQLALEPCSGSSVIIDTKTGELLACVTYPGYDNNQLANSVDSSYYSYLSGSLSNPLYNHATQQRTAPGSTFKIVSATAGLSEGVITTTETIQDLGQYESVSNRPKCWFYPNGTHGFINVSQAIRDSCNYFFYEVGYRLAGSARYSDSAGIRRIQKYAALYGLDEETGIEIEENEPHIATEFPVMAAIGQSDNNYTTVSLARYATAVANNGTVYRLSLLREVEDSDGKTLESFGPQVRNQIDILSGGEWNALHSGMRMVVEELSSFDNFPVSVAGKTGTAEINNHPNHALFIGYAPYEDPQIAIATRIAYGYTSHNAADVSRSILAYYFNLLENPDIINGEASTVTTDNAVTD